MADESAIGVGAAAQAEGLEETEPVSGLREDSGVNAPQQCAYEFVSGTQVQQYTASIRSLKTGAIDSSEVAGRVWCPACCTAVPTAPLSSSDTTYSWPITQATHAQR